MITFTYWHALVLGIVEGITEFLPISSTGHLILAAKLMNLGETNFAKSFEIIVQLGAMGAVAAVYWKKFYKNFAVWKKIAAAFLPTAVIGFILYKIIKQYLLGNSAVVVWSLLLGGAAIIIFELIQRDKPTKPVSPLAEVTYKQSVIIGLFQALAVIPGVSRSAATIIGGRLLGLNQQTIVEFSFLLALPTLAAATGLDLLKSYDNFAAGQLGILALGLMAAFVTAWLAVKWLLEYIQNHNFMIFGIYRVIIAIIFFLFILK